MGAAADGPAHAREGRDVDVTIDLGGPAEHAVIAVRGDLDVHTASALREALHCLLAGAGGEDLTVDATAVRVVDDAGRATLDSVTRHCREFGGRVRLPEGGA
jgi:anti-anti-sigma factor